MMTSAAPESSGSAPRDAWMWNAPMQAAPNAHAYWDMNPERAAHSPSRYMMYRPEGEHAALANHAPPFFSAPQPPMYSYSMPVHPDMNAHMQRMGAPGYAMMPFPGYPMVDQESVPMMMPMPHAGLVYGMHPHDKSSSFSLEHDRPDALEPAWDRGRDDHEFARDTNMDELLVLSRQAQTEAGGNANVFVCPHCEKRYVGKHARSIWRRHLQDKHAIPLSVQPRRTRWDRDANRPRNAEERRERMLESKRRWARKKREQERHLARGTQPDASLLASPAPESAEPAAPPTKAPSVALPTPPRAALAPRDTNVRPPPEAASPAPASKSKATHSTPLRAAWTTMHSPENYEPTKRPTAPGSLTKRSALDRAALAAFSRVEPSPRVFVPASASKREKRLSYTDFQGSPTAPSGKRHGDQFSSPQHLNLTHSLGLAPHSASKNGGAYPAMFPGISMTPMQGGLTPYSKMPLGLTPTIGGLLRPDMMMPPSAGGTAFFPATDMMSYATLDTPSTQPPRPPRRADPAFHSSSEREEEELDQENDQRLASPSIRPRPRTQTPLTHETPSKMHPSVRSTRLPTPRSSWQRIPHNARFR